MTQDENELADAKRDAQALSTKREAILVGYTNWRGEYAVRTIVPQMLWFGSTEWHSEPQWLIKALDVEKGALRDFALSGFAALPGTVQPVAVAVKGLRWTTVRSGLLYADGYKISKGVGYCHLNWHDGWVALSMGQYPNIEAAQAAANAHRETRIRSSLIPATMAGEGAAMRDALQNLRQMQIEDAPYDGDGSDDEIEQYKAGQIDGIRFAIYRIEAALANPRLPGEGSK